MTPVPAPLFRPHDSIREASPSWDRHRLSGRLLRPWSGGKRMNPHDITALLNRVTEGDLAAKEELYRRLYEELMRLARTHRYRAGHITLDAPAILNESFLRFRSGVFPNRRAFLGYASTVMHTVIVDYVRERKAQKRGGELRNELT